MAMVYNPDTFQWTDSSPADRSNWNDRNPLDVTSYAHPTDTRGWTQVNDQWLWTGGGDQPMTSPWDNSNASRMGSRMTGSELQSSYNSMAPQYRSVLDARGFNPESYFMANGIAPSVSNQTDLNNILDWQTAIERTPSMNESGGWGQIMGDFASTFGPFIAAPLMGAWGASGAGLGEGLSAADMAGGLLPEFGTEAAYSAGLGGFDPVGFDPAEGLGGGGSSGGGSFGGVTSNGLATTGFGEGAMVPVTSGWSQWVNNLKSPKNAAQLAKALASFNSSPSTGSGMAAPAYIGGGVSSPSSPTQAQSVQPPSPLSVPEMASDFQPMKIEQPSFTGFQQNNLLQDPFAIANATWNRGR